MVYFDIRETVGVTPTMGIGGVVVKRPNGLCRLHFDTARPLERASRSVTTT